MKQLYKWFIQFLFLIFSGIYVIGQPYFVIQIGLPFFVQTSASTEAVPLHENSKISSTGNNDFRPLNRVAGLVKLDTRLYSINGSTNNFADANVVVFDNAYSNAVDGDDATKLANSGENLGILRDNQVLVIEARQSITNRDTIFYKMWNMLQQNYRLEFVPNELNIPGLSAVLQDAFLNTNTNIDLSITSNYNFIVNASPASSASNRFRLLFVQSTPLPVNFISIVANRFGNNIKVDWQVAEERSILKYEVLRSVDGRNFSSVGIIPANASTFNYSWIDWNITMSTFYYRIKTIGISGDEKYTQIVKVTVGKQSQGFSISPNPVESGIVNLQFNQQPAGNYQVRVFNLNGQAILNQQIKHTESNSLQLIKLPESLSTGIYKVEVNGNNMNATILSIQVVGVLVD